jgi:hypothetical protein
MRGRRLQIEPSALVMMVARGQGPPWQVAASSSPRKEVIQPQVPLRLPCYDFAPVADLTVVGRLPLLGQQDRLRVKPTPMA